MNKNMNKKIFNLGILALAVVLITGGVFIQQANAAITSITVTDPDGSEIWSGSHNITWTTVPELEVDPVNIYYCVGTNCTENSYTLIAAGEGNDGTYSWDTTTAGGDATTYKVRVARQADPTIADNSNAVFTVDNTVPLISISDDASGSWTNSDTIAVTTSDATAGLLETKWVVQAGAVCGVAQDGALDAGTTGISMVADDDAIYQNQYICFRSKDNADVANKNYAISAQITKLDTTDPEITSTAPVTDASIKEQKVSYTLSEAITTGAIVFTRTGGTEDGNIHTCTLQGTALNTGEHANLTLETGDNACVAWANPLVDGTIYTVTFDAADAATNSATTVTNTGITYDTTVPTIAVDAIVGTTISEAGDTIVITFSEPVVTHDGGAWAIEEMPTIVGSETGALTLTNAGFSYAGSALTITLNEATDDMYLKNGETITVTPGASKIKDTAGNFVAAAEVIGTTAVTGDVVAPTVALTYDVDQTVYKDGDSVTITATFDEDAEDTAGSVPTIAIATLGDGSVTATDMSIGANRKIWTYIWTVPAGDDEDGTATVTIVATDLAGNANAAATNNTKTIDNTVPTLPAAGIIGITIQGADDTIILTFSEAVQPDDGTWSSNEISAVQSPDGTTKTLVGMTFSPTSGATTTLTITFAEDATDAETYLINGNKVVVTPGENKIKDAAGNFVAITPVTSTANVGGDIDLPTLSSITYTQGSTVVTVIRPSAYGLTVKVTATFTEAMTTAPTVWIQAPGTDADVATTTMSSTSATEWYYNWTVPNTLSVQGEATITFAGTDLAGNIFDSAATQSVVIDESGPVISNVTLDLPQYRLTQDPTVTVTVIEDNTASTVTVNGESATESPAGTWTGSFAHGKSSIGTYSFNVVATDAYSNVTTQQVQYYVVADDAPAAPSIAITAPIGGAQITTASYSITFTTNSGATTDAYVLIDGASWVAATTNANPGTYTLDVSALINGSHTVRVKDTVNGVVGYSNTVSFITAYQSDSTHPTVSSIYPTNGTTGVSISVIPTITFSESMDTTTFDPDNIQLRKSADDTVATSTIHVVDGNKVAWIYTDELLDYLTDYYIYAGTGVKDVAGNALEAAYGSTSISAFTTAAEGDASLGVTGAVAERTWAVPGGDFDDGWKWIISVDVPTDETQLQMKFSDWTGTGTTIGAADNIQFYSEQALTAVDQDHAIAITVADTYSAIMTLNDDKYDNSDGRQVQIILEVQVPSGSTGSYSSSYGIQTTEPS